MEKTQGRAYLSVGALALIRGLAGPGLFSSMGVFFPYIAASRGLSLSALSWTVSLAALSGAVFLPAAGKMYERYGARRMTLCGILLTAPVFALFGVAGKLWMTYLLAVPFGCGTVLLVNLMAPLFTERLFGTRQGGALGVLMAGSGAVGAAVQPLLAFWLASRGWQTAYFLLGGTAFCLMLLGFSQLPHLSVTPRDDPSAPSAETSRPHATAKNKRRENTLVFLTLFLFQGVVTGYSHFRQSFAMFHQTAGFSQGILSLSLTFSMIGAAVGALSWGALTKRRGAAQCGSSVLLLGGISVLLFFFGAETPAAYLIACTLHGVVSAAIGVTVPALARECLPERDYGRALSRVMVSAPLATVLFMQLYGALYDASGSFVSSLWLLFFTLFTMLLLWWRCFGVSRAHRGRKPVSQDT